MPVLTVDGRTKRLYSIHQKLRRQKIDLDQVYDFIALRIVTKTIKDCYAALGHHPPDLVARARPHQGLHRDAAAQRVPVAAHLRDQRARAAVRGADPDARRCTAIAEEGIAAHWKYKEGRVGAERDEPLLRWLRQLLEWQQEVHDPQEFIQHLKIDLYPEEVYTFTPKGQVKPLPRGATPVDFAYAIHTDVGHQCVGARVNGRMVPLRTPLKNGDIVEIITQKNHRPSRDWLNFVATSRARNKIKQSLEAEEKVRAIDVGRKLLEKEARRFDLSMRLLDDEALQKAAAALGAQKGDEVLASVGFGKLQPRQVLDKLVPAEQLHREACATASCRWCSGRSSRDGDKIKVRGADDLLVVRARCCNPIRGEKIVGYITRGKGVSVHSVACPNVTNLLYTPDRRIEVEWDRAAEAGGYPVDLLVNVEDRKGLLAEISAKIDANITNIEAKTRDGRLDHINMTLEIRDFKHLEKVLKSLRKVAGVLEVERA